MTSKAMTMEESGTTNDRDVDCAAYLRVGFDRLIADAMAAGWSADEIGNALLGLAQDRVTSARDDALLGVGPAANGYKH